MNDNTCPPDFSPGLPVYPEVAQAVRIPVGTAPLTGNVYACFTQQFVPPLGLRDREAAYVFEPNNITLRAGIYDCRLMSSHLGLPLYLTHCCPQASSSSAGG